MSVIAKAIADRQSEIERLQAEIKALNDVDKILGASAPAKPAGSALLLAAAGGCRHPGSGDRVRRHPDEEAPSDDDHREGGGVRADESLLGPRAERKPRSSRPPAAGGFDGRYSETSRQSPCPRRL